MSLPSPYRQLNQRTADGLAVTLEWNPTTDALRIVVVDHASEAVRFPVRAADAEIVAVCVASCSSTSEE